MLVWSHCVIIKKPTDNLQSQAVSWRITGQCHLETTGDEKRRQNVSHDVDVCLFLSLELFPDNRVVEHVEVFGVEFAIKLDALSRVEHMNLALGPHREENAEN